MATPGGVSLRPAVTADRVGRGAWSVAAQALSSGSNVALQLGLLLTLDPASFGSVVVGFSCYYLALALGRARVGDPLAALAGEPAGGAGREGPVDPARLWPGSRRRLLAIGSVAAVAAGAVAWLAAPVRFELLLLAVASPVLLLQDGYRYLLWARGQPHRLVVMDGLWLGVFGAAVAAAAVTTGGSDPVSAPAVVGAWVGGGLVSAAAGPLLHRGQVPTAGWPDRPPWPGAAARTALGPRGPAEAPVRPAGRLTAAEGRVVRSLGRSQTILALDANGLPALVAVVAGSTVTGGLRAATVPFLPMVSILGAIRVLTLPVLRRSVVDGHPAQTVGKVLGLYAVVAGAIAATGLGLVYTVPPAWLGEAGQLARPWYPLAAVVVAARMLSLPLADVLSLGAGPELAVRCRAATTALDWLATAGGAASFGLPGAIAAKAAALLVAIAIWLAATARALARADDGARALARADDGARALARADDGARAGPGEA